MQETQEMQLQSLDREDPPEQEVTLHSGSLAREIPQTEELGGLRFLRSQRIGCNWAGTHARTWVLGEMSPQDILQLLVAWGCLLPSTLCWLVSRCFFYLMNSLQKHSTFSGGDRRPACKSLTYCVPILLAVTSITLFSEWSHEDLT